MIKVADVIYKIKNLEELARLGDKDEVLLLTINTFSLEYLPYQGKFKEIETEHFKIIFAEKMLWCKTN